MSSLPTPLPLLLLFSSLWSSSFVGMSLDFHSYNISEKNLHIFKLISILNFENILCKPQSFLIFFFQKKKISFKPSVSNAVNLIKGHLTEWV